MKKISKIPEFKSDVEAARFWDAHNSTQYLSQTKSVSLKFPKPSHKVVVELRERQWKRLQHLAQQKKTSLNHLLEKLLEEKLTASH